MAVKALTPGRVIEHIFSGDVRPARIEGTPEAPEPDNSAHDNWKPTKWKLKCLDSRLLGILKDRSTKIKINPAAPDEEIGTEVNMNLYNFDVVSLALDEPENYDTPVKFGTHKRNIGGVSYPIANADYVGTIPDFVLSELAEVVIGGNSLSDDEKNG